MLAFAMALPPTVEPTELTARPQPAAIVCAAPLSRPWLYPPDDPEGPDDEGVGEGEGSGGSAGGSSGSGE